MNRPNLIQRTWSLVFGKAQRDSGRFLSAVPEFQGISKGSKARPFRQDQAVRRFYSWVYVAAMLNATAFAAQSRRLYLRKGTRGTKLFRSRPVQRKNLAYLLGDAQQRPSARVLAKIADFGSDFEEVTEPHPILKVLSTVNPWQNGFELDILRMLFLQMTGNAYLHPILNGPGMTPGELWLMPSHQVKVLPDVHNFIRGYYFGRTPEGKEFTADEVIQFKLPSLTDPWYGMGRLEAVWTALGLHIAKREVDTARYDNYCRPDWIIGAEGASADALTRIEDAVEQRLLGTHNAGKMIAVNGKVTGLALNLADSVIGDPDRVIEEISAGFGVPIMKMLANDPIKANTESGDAGWLRDTILPYLRLDEEQLNARWVPLWGEDVANDAVIAYDNPVPADKQFELDQNKASLGGAPWKLVNEVRKDQGLDEIEGGNVLLVPTTLMPTGSEPPPGPLAGMFNVSPATGAAPGTPAVGGSPDVQSTVLNGAQMAAMAGIVAQVSSGEIPRDSGVQMLAAGLQIDVARADAIMGTAGTKKPTTANPNPAAEAATNDANQAGRVGVSQGGGSGQDPSGGKSVHKRTGDADNAGKTDSRDSAAGDSRHDPVGGTKSHAKNSDALAAILRAVFAEQKAHAMAWASGKQLKQRVNIVGVTRDGWAINRGDAKAEKPKPGEPGYVPPEPLPYLSLDLTAWNEKLANAAQPAIEQTLRDAAKATIGDYKLPDAVFEVVDRNLPKAAQELTLKFSEATNATTSLKINDALAKLRTEIEHGVIEGDAPAKMAERVQEVFEEADKSRAKTIAKTETSRARHTAEIITAKESKVVQSKLWLASSDCCDKCAEYAEKSADGIPLDEPYDTTDYGPVDCPPGHPNCQCSQTLNLNDEYKPGQGQAE